ncbi:unnamed protein product [Urochloa decumbens]|uniref:Bowman-Birk serine protease inhibitors family domain-containing protein n=1 Tax=Urochloa decumbens TaxID=240449 RepID=A0ABC9C373_9POAL
MMGNGAASLVFTRTILVVVVLFSGCLALTAQCHFQSRDVVVGGTKKYPNTSNSTAITMRSATPNSTLINDDESKIYISFCKVKSVCYKGEACYCCLQPIQKCFFTEAECRANCAVCNPHCHQPQTNVEGR